MLKTINKRISRRQAVYLFFVVYYALYTIREFFRKEVFGFFPKELWAKSEWLVNYQGGFVRRGLGGEVVWQLYQNFGIDPDSLIWLICFSSYLLLAILMIRSFLKNEISLIPLICLCLLSGPVYYGHIIREDIFNLMLFFTALVCYSKKGFLYWVLGALAICFAILNHEMVGFVALPSLFLIAIHAITTQRTVRLRFLKPVFVFLLPFLAFAAVSFTSKVDSETIRLIRDSWANVPLDSYNDVNNNRMPSVDFMDRGLKGSLLFVKDNVMNFSGDYFGGLVSLLPVPFTLYLFLNLYRFRFGRIVISGSRPFDQQYFSKLIILQLIAIFPLFILATDYSRWYFSWVTSTFFLYFIFPQSFLVDWVDGIVVKVQQRINSFLNSFVPRSTEFVYILPLVLGYVDVGWHFDIIDDIPMLIILKSFSIEFFHRIFRWIPRLIG